MTDLIPDGVLADVRALQAAAMPESITVVETSVTFNGRVTDKHSYERHFPGMPQWYLLRWTALELPYGTVVEQGQHLQLGDGTTYVVLSVPPQHVTYGSLTVVDCINSAVAMRNQTVSIYSNETNSAIVTDLPAVIWPAALDIQVRPQAANYHWALGLPTNLDGQIATGDTLTCAFLRSSVEITRPRFNADPSNPLLVSYFNEPLG